MPQIIKYFSMFTGIGGFEYGIERSNNQETSSFGNPQSRSDCFDANGGSEHSDGDTRWDCVGYSEIDKHATAIFKYHYPDLTNFADATKIDPMGLPDFDVLVGGFPCQSFSIAGQRMGFEDTRGTLFFEIARVARIKRPRFIWLENVEGLLNHDGGRTFACILTTLSELGYDAEWSVLDSQNFGVPQHRERVFIIGHLREQRSRQIFPIGKPKIDGASDPKRKVPVTATISTKEGMRWWSTMIHAGTLRRGEWGTGLKNDCAFTMDSGCGRDLLVEQKILQHSRTKDGDISYNLKDVAGTVKPPTGNQQNFINNNHSIRRLTPIECERLQGFPDDWTKFGINEKGVKYALADTPRYKCLGNAVTTNVITAIVKELQTLFEAF